MTTAGKGTWCGRCHHMIERLPVYGGYGHVSRDDWAGPYSECACVIELASCVPETPARKEAVFLRPSSVRSNVVDFFWSASNVA